MDEEKTAGESPDDGDEVLEADEVKSSANVDTAIVPISHDPTTKDHTQLTGSTDWEDLVEENNNASDSKDG